MSDRKHSKIAFTNAETVFKRAWIERALASVRGRFSGGEDDNDTIDKPGKPNLYVIDSDRPR